MIWVGRWGLVLLVDSMAVNMRVRCLYLRARPRASFARIKRARVVSHVTLLRAHCQHVQTKRRQNITYDLAYRIWFVQRISMLRNCDARKTNRTKQHVGEFVYRKTVPPVTPFKYTQRRCSGVRTENAPRINCLASDIFHRHPKQNAEQRI